jgi:hypothetical protein
VSVSGAQVASQIQSGMQTAGYPPSKRITHIEIRRVQNGFVVMAYDFTHDYSRMTNDGVQACYVASDEKELANIIQAFALGTDMKWVPSMDMPITGFFNNPVRVENKL